MPDRIGYVVIEYNQASHQPDVLDGSFCWKREDAAVLAELERRKTAGFGRLERYTIAEVIELGEGDD